MGVFTQIKATGAFDNLKSFYEINLIIKRTARKVNNNMVTRRCNK